MKEPVDLQEPFSIEAKYRIFLCQEAVVAQAVERLRESLFDVDTELVLEVVRFDIAELHLKNELADHALFRSRRECARNRQLARAQPSGVALEVRLVLEMRPADVRERCDAQSEHICAAP